MDSAGGGACARVGTAWRLDSCTLAVRDHAGGRHVYGFVLTAWRRLRALVASCADAVCKRLKPEADGAAGRGRTAWDGVQSALLLVSAVFIPPRLAFPQAFPTAPWDAAELAIDCLLLLGVLVSLCTPYYREGRTVLVSSPTAVLRHNARRWLLLDLVAAFPLALLLHQHHFAAGDAGTSGGSGGGGGAHGGSSNLPSDLPLLPLLRALQSLRVRTHTPPCAAVRACPVSPAPLAPRTLLRCSFLRNRLAPTTSRS